MEEIDFSYYELFLITSYCYDNVATKYDYS